MRLGSFATPVARCRRTLSPPWRPSEASAFRPSLSFATTIAPGRGYTFLAAILSLGIPHVLYVGPAGAGRCVDRSHPRRRPRGVLWGALILVVSACLRPALPARRLTGKSAVPA